MGKFTKTQWISIAAITATIVIGGLTFWKSAATTNSTFGDHSPIVNGNAGPVVIGK
jgi:hypothetical protein